MEPVEQQLFAGSGAKVFCPGSVKNRWVFLNYMGKMVRVGAGAGARIFDKLKPETELEPHKNGPAPQH
jgi:hypothetical protein